MGVYGVVVVIAGAPSSTLKLLSRLANSLLTGLDTVEVVILEAMGGDATFVVSVSWKLVIVYEGSYGTLKLELTSVTFFNRKVKPQTPFTLVFMALMALPNDP